MPSEKSSDTSNEYKSVTAITPQSKALEHKPTWLGRKYLKIKKALGDFWVVGRYGFQLGGMAGLCLGFLVGGYESIRMKSIWPIPIAMIGSGITFGSIFAISTVLRAHINDSSEEIEVIYYDDQDKIIKRINLSLINKSDPINFNKRI